MKERLECEIKKLQSFEEFEKVFKAYGFFPYYERWEPEEIREEYEFNLKNGFLYGCFNDGDCVGIVTMCASIHCDHPIHFKEPEKVLYISNLVVSLKHRYHGFGTALAEFAASFAEKNRYKTVYFRYRERQELGIQIAKRLEFQKIPDVCEEVSRNRTAKEYTEQYQKGTDLRFFMKKELG